MPPWGKVLGGEIFIHEGGTDADWTQGCIVLRLKDIDILFSYLTKITQVKIKL
jgi:L,D-peptidoglycan transpeptidase YkuD (ErfK/YbiS/YcfS/YnhG family)